MTDADGLGTFSYQWKRTVGRDRDGHQRCHGLDLHAGAGGRGREDHGDGVSWTDQGGTAESLTSAATAAVANVNDLPVASAISRRPRTEDTALSFAASDFTGAFSDPDGHTLKSVKLVTLPTAAQGVLKVGTSAAAANQVVLKASLATISFAPAANFNGPASFTYKVDRFSSGQESAAAATVTVTVSAVNDAASVASAIEKTTAEDTALTFAESDFTGAFERCGQSRR